MISQLKMLPVKIHPWLPLLPWAGFAAGAAMMGSAYLHEPGSLQRVSFWLGLLVFCLPAFWRILSPSTSRRERILILVAAGVFTYLPKVFACPQYFCLPGELSWWLDVQNLLDGRGLPVNGLAGPGAGSFPGLPMITAVLQQATGQSIFQAGMILAGILHVLGLLAVYLLAERMFLSQRAGGAVALMYLALPGFLWSSTQFSGAAMAGTLLLVAVLAAQSLAEADKTVDRPGWGMVILILILMIVVTHPGAALFFAGILILMAVAARLLPHFTVLTAPHTLGRFGLFATIAAAAWLLTYSVDSIMPIAVGMQNAFQESVQVLPVLLTPGGIPALFVLLGVLFLSSLGVWLIFRMGLPVLAASFGILASGLLLIAYFPLLISGASNGTYLPWMVTSLGASLLGGLAIAWFSARRARREGKMISALRRAVPVLLIVFLLVAGILTAPPYPEIPGLQLPSQPGAMKPGHMEAAQWMFNQAGPGNRLMSDELTMQVFSSYGRQEPAYRLPGNRPAAMDAPTWSYDALYSIIQTKTSYFVVDDNQAKPEIANHTVRSTNLGLTRPISEEALLKFDDLTFLSRIYDAGNLRIYQLSDGKGNEQVSSGIPGMAKLKPTTPEEASTVPIPGEGSSAQALLVILLLLSLPGYMAGKMFFNDWERMDLLTRSVLAIALSIVVDCVAGFLSILIPGGIKNAQVLAFGWAGASALVLYRTAIFRSLRGEPVHLPVPRWPAETGQAWRAVPVAAVLMLAGIWFTNNSLQNMLSNQTGGTVFSLELSAPLRVRVTSHESMAHNYYLTIQNNDGSMQKTRLFALEPGQAKEIDLTGRVRGEGDQSLLTINLMIDGQEKPHRSLRLPGSQVQQLARSTP